MNTLKKKIISLTLSGALLTSLSSCSSEKLLKNTHNNSNNSYNYAAIIINDDNATVFLDNYYVYNNQYGDKYIDYNDNKFYMENICEVNYVDKDDLEVKVKKIIGKDGSINYYS